MRRWCNNVFFNTIEMQKNLTIKILNGTIHIIWCRTETGHGGGQSVINPYTFFIFGQKYTRGDFNLSKYERKYLRV